MATALQLTSYSRNLTQNKRDHHTSDYRTSQPVMRRGQKILYSLSFNRAPKPSDTIQFLVEIAKSANSQKKLSTTFPLSTTGSTRGAWTAVADSLTSKTVNVSITSPSDAVIGSCRLVIQLFSEGYRSHVLGDMWLICNPWTPEDDVYMANESERQEYVLSDNTIIYKGNENNISSQGWNLGQFEDAILPICFKILEKQTAVDFSRLGNPIEVSRVCSAMINSNDDKGVITGNWSGNYAGGKSPSSWTGSVDILKKWASSGPVNYGQCWVFAGTLCSVFRSLGIPCRVVTNFSSAHDTNENLSIDTYYDYEGNNLGGDDSIWNFHVWVEAWMARPDIGSYYNGWQVLDATPQETSAGVFRLGPTPVIAVKEGDINMSYDCPFVFSEVNADTISWLYDEDTGDSEQVRSNRTSVGKFTSTKAVGTNSRADITSNYKYREGSAQERESYDNAVNQIYGRRAASTDEHDGRGRAAPAAVTFARNVRVKPATNVNLSAQFKDCDPIVIGQDVQLTLAVKNTSAVNKVICHFSAKSTGYRRRVMRNVVNDAVTISMGPNEEKEIPFTLPYSKYRDCLTDDKVLEVTALCKGDDNNKFLVTKVITLESPSMIIKVLNKPVLNKPLNAEIIIENPLDETLNGCELSVEGSGLVTQQIKRTISLKPKEKAKVGLEITPYKKGSKQLQVVLSCHRMKHVKAFTFINVAEA
ncbi:protein-glutamine gamma-glutamyltransferase E-like [Eleutherodactylus coqui]|uniref:protein-glutamine gamma-glutamyltransferase E-like n=1 Tax=Eleutherodactylus coqui TaxID=57060 RepID=UPI003461D0B2